MYKDILEFISTIGFPSACVIGCGWFIKYMFDKMLNIIMEVKDVLTELKTLMSEMYNKKGE